MTRPKRRTTRYCSFDCYMANIANRPSPKRVHSNEAIVSAIENSPTVSAAARSLGYNPENIYNRAQRSPAIREALAEIRKRNNPVIRYCLVCPKRVGRKAAKYCSMACYWIDRRENGLRESKKQVPTAKQRRDARHTRIIELHKDGVTATQIAARLGLYIGTVHRVIGDEFTK